MSARFTLDQISAMPPSIQAQVKAELERPAKALPLAFIGDKHPTPPPLDKTPPRASKPAKKRIRQNSAGLNKTEQAFLDFLKESLREFGEVRTPILSQCVTLKLGNGVRYTPDFMIPQDGKHLAYEVKGFLRDDANVKLKVAASVYPWIRFHLVTRKKGEWIIQEVLA